MWVLKNNFLALDNKGQYSIPRAVEIFDNVFYSVEYINGKKVPSVKDEFPEILFQDFVAGCIFQISSFSSYLEDGFTLTLHAKFEGESLELPLDVLLLCVDHVVLDNRWIPLDSGLISLLSEKVISLNIDSSRINLRQYIELKKDPQLSNLIEDLTGNISYSESFLPKNALNKIKGLKANLYPYQEKGISWLRALSKHDVGVILGDEMGLGKTLQIISLLLLEKHERQEQKSLIVVPASLIENWKREFHKFAPDLKIYTHHGNDRELVQKIFSEHDVTITTYDVVSNDIYLLKHVHWNLLILDEGHVIRNPDARRTKMVKELRKRMGIIVTGTPLVNKLTDLWSVTDFITPEYLGIRDDFERQYPYTTSSASKLEEKVSPIMLRREVSSVAEDLPEKIIIPQWIRFSPAERDAYTAILEETLQNNQPSIAGLVRLRMYCCHPLLADIGYKYPIDYFSKFIRFLEVMEEIASCNEKVLVFTDFVENIKILDNEIARRFGIYTNTIYGGTAISERQKIIDEFSAVSGTACLILNYVAGGVGLNIQSANHVVLYNPVWNPADEEQAVARSYRRGQEKKVRVHRFNIASSIEEIIDDKLSVKRDMIENAIEGVDGGYADIKEIWSHLRQHTKE